MSYKRLQPIETLDYILANFPDDGEREKAYAEVENLQTQLVVLKGRAEKAETEWKYICDNWDGKMKELDEKDVEIARLKASIAELERR
jgi:hypothetical protein